MRFSFLPLIVVFAALLNLTAETSFAQSDAQFLNDWAAEARTKLPQSIGEVQMTEVTTFCPTGCQKPYSASYLAISAWTPRLTQQQVTIGQLQQALKPQVLQNYCGDVLRQRNINLAIYISDMNKVFIGTVAINPTDCPAMQTQTPTPTQKTSSPNAQFLNQWAVDTNSKLPVTTGDFQLFNAIARCPNGCQQTDSVDYLLIQAKTPRFAKQNLNIGQIERALKPELLPEYCGSPGKAKNIMLGIFVNDMNNQTVGNFWIYPKDCPSNISQNAGPTPTPQNTPASTNQTAPGKSVEDEYWDAVKNSSRVQDYQGYLRDYPNGKYAALARLKIGQLSVNTTQPTPTPAPATNSNIEEQYWENVKNSSRAQDFQSYLNDFPNGKYAQIARLRINQLNNSNPVNTPNNSPNPVNNPVNPVNSAQREADILNVVYTAGKPAPPKPPANRVTTEPATYSPDGETRYINERHDDSNNIDSILHLGLNDDLIWPGNLIRGNQINDFVYIPISVQRAPITISVSAEGSSNTGSAIKETVSDPNLGNMRQGIANLLKKAIGPNTRLPARVDFSKEEVHSESQVNASVGAAVSYGVGSLKTDFSWNSQREMHRIVAKYTQVYFTVDVNTPRTPAELLDPSIPVDSIQRAMPQGSNPLYVSSVSYGMMALMFMESTFSSDEMKTALDAAYKGGVDVKVNARYSAKDILQNSKLKILVYGGSTAGLRDIETGFDGFMKVVRASNTYSPDSPGVPISYKFRNLQDNSLTFLALTSQYTLRKPVKLKQRVKITVDNMICTLSDDEGSNNDADMDRFSLAYYPSNAAKDGTLIPQKGETLYDWSTSGEVTTGVGYVWQVNRSAIVTFETDPDKFDFNRAVLVINGYGREYDSTGSNEEGRGTIKLVGPQMLGRHKFQITSSDFIYDVNVLIELVD